MYFVVTQQQCFIKISVIILANSLEGLLKKPTLTFISRYYLIIYSNNILTMHLLKINNYVTLFLIL